MYLTYDEFEAMGGTLAEEVFQRLEMRARGYLDRVTMGRLQKENPLRESAKHAMFSLVNVMAEDAQHGGREIQSLTNDGVSVKYMPLMLQARCMHIVRDFLMAERTNGGTGLMYAGVDA